MEMRLKSTNLDPEKAAEYRFLQQVVGELQAKAPRSMLDAFAKKCGFKPRHAGERIADTRERLLKAWEEAVGSGLPVRDEHLLCVREMHARKATVARRA